MLSTLISLLSPIPMFYMLHLQMNQTRLLERVSIAVSQIEKSKSGLVVTPTSFNQVPESAKNRKAILFDGEYVNMTAKELWVSVCYDVLVHALKSDGSEVVVKFYSTTHPGIQNLNLSLKKMGFQVVEQPVFFSQGKTINTNIDALMIEGVVIDALPEEFETIVLVSGDHKFAKCANLSLLRGQKVEFIAFDYNTSHVIKELAQSHDMVSYRPLRSIPGVCKTAPPRRRPKQIRV